MLRANKNMPVALAEEPASGSGKDMEDRQEAIRRALWNLRESERELIVMRYFDGFSKARIIPDFGGN